jgi:hypothetical protein
MWLRLMGYVTDGGMYVAEVDGLCNRWWYLVVVVCGRM